MRYNDNRDDYKMMAIYGLLILLAIILAIRLAITSPSLIHTRVKIPIESEK